MGGRAKNRIRELRAELLLSQEKLAHKAGLAVGTVNRAERGQQVPNVVTQEKIARALGVSRSEVFPGDELQEASA